MRKRNHQWVLLLCAALAATGCGDDGAADPGAGGAGGAGGSGGAGGEELAPGTSALEPLEAEPAFAVINSDYSSSSIAMLDEDFELLAESWLNSGSEYPGLVAALSGDVTLPSRQPGGGVFALLDRLNTDVYSEFYTLSGNLNGQVRTRSETPGFAPNPNDVIYLSENSAWVTRYEPNLDAEAAPEDGGNDLIELDPRSMSLTGRRIDLSELNQLLGDEEVSTLVHARPNRAVLVGTTAIVGLDLISADFASYGSGTVAVVDLEEGTVQGLPLPGMQNCGRVVPVPGAEDEVLVSCNGPFVYDEAFNLDVEAKREGSGIALIKVSDGVASIEQSWTAAGTDAALATSWLIAIDAQRAVGVAEGDYNLGTPDELYITEIATGLQTRVYEGQQAFDLGVPAYDPELQLLFLPEASSGEVIQLGVDEDGATELGSTRIAPGGLPPRQVYSLQ